MDEKYCFFWGTIICLVVISDSRVIVPRALPKDASSRNDELPLSLNPLEKDNKLDSKAIIGGPSEIDDDYGDNKENIDPAHRFFDDYPPGRVVNEIDNLPGTNPEKIPDDEYRGENPQEIPGEKNSNDKADDENFNKSLDEEDFDKTGVYDKDLELAPDEGKPIHKDGDKDDSEVTDDADEKPEEEDNDDKPQDETKFAEENPAEEKIDEEIPDEEKFYEDNSDEEKFGEEKKDEEKDESEDNDEKDYVPEESVEDENKDNEIPKEVDEETVEDEDDNVDENIPQEGEPESFFDTPFFNIEQVKKYFKTLDRALGHIFRQTVDEAVLLNGTYANTTEEEVDINGKKYIVTKSVLKGADNHSMMYVEALSAKPKMNDSEVVLSDDMKNVTKT